MEHLACRLSSASSLEGIQNAAAGMVEVPSTYRTADEIANVTARTPCIKSNSHAVRLHKFSDRDTKRRGSEKRKAG